MARRVVVLGGGLSGLTFAWALKRAAPAAAVTLAEATPRAGGWLFSHRGDDGFLFERGCRGVRGGRPEGDGAVVLATLLDLGLLEGRAEGAAMGNHALARRRFVKHGGALHEMPASPAGLLGWPPLPNPLWVAASEAFRPAAAAPGEDESVLSFVTRRLGAQVAERLVDAMLAGVWAGRADELSVQAVFPQLAALEAEAGSLTAGFARRGLARLTGREAEAWQPPLSPWFERGRAAAAADAEERCRASAAVAASGVAGATSISTSEGTEGITRALAADAAALGVDVRLGVAAASVSPSPSGGAVVTLAPTPGASAGMAPLSDTPPLGRATERLEADLVVSALPSPALASALQAGLGPSWRDEDRCAVEGDALPLLRSVPRATVGVACAGWSHPAVREGARRRGFGYLSPSAEDGTVLGTVWDSCVFPGQALDGRRALEDRATVMMGGRRDPAVASWSEERLSAEARAALVRDTGVPAGDRPAAERAWLAEEAIPQYTVGHLDRVAALQAGLHQAAPWLRLLGNSFFGVGAAACIANAAGAAATVASSIE